MMLFDFHDIAVRFICLLSMLLCVGSFWNILQSYKLKHHFYMVASVVQLVISFELLCVFIEVIEWKKGGLYVHFIELLVNTPRILWIVAIVLITISVVIVMHLNLLWRRTHVTEMSIRECRDTIPAGICYYRKNGRVVFANRAMLDLCFMITGETLLNARDFYKELKDNIVILEDGIVWQFIRRELEFKGDLLYELIATDITEVFVKTRELREDVEKAKLLSNTLAEYNANIDDFVREQEILQAKIKVHDEMNRIMLTAYATVGDEDAAEERENVLKIWEQNTLFLAIDARKETLREIMRELNKTAHLMGINLIWKERYSSISSEYLSVIKTMAGESMSNAIKHADAENLWISIHSDKEMIEIIFENDGNIPDGEINESGGITNMRSIAERMGGRIEIKVGSRFEMHVFLPNES